MPFLEEAPQLKVKIVEKADAHWAFQPIGKPALPEVKQKSWAKNPIDLFILQMLEEAGRAPAEPADSHTLLRRAHFDLLGLPPDPESIEKFVQNPDWPSLIKELLDKPFFLACGFVRPHVPLVAPAKYFDRYDRDAMIAPVVPENDLEDVPEIIRNYKRNSTSYGVTPELHKGLLEAYYASISYMDAQVGRVLDALEELGLAKNTIVVFTSDHGYLLGHHHKFQKQHLFEEATRVPFIVSVPWMNKQHGKGTKHITELIDLYPTLADLTAPQAFCDWKPVSDRIMTQWADDVDPDNVLPEYPRPQLVRSNWVNLNGLWDYSVTPKDASQPIEFEGQILVPFCIESALSGVKRKFTRDDRLWYSRSFTAPPLTSGERLRLNFGAVDYETAVLVNGQEVGTQVGGYDAFSFDITDALKPGENTLVVSVTDDQSGPKGKQKVGAFDNPRFIFYTATSGIWQTVWLEKVPASHIGSLKITPDIDKGTVAVTVKASSGTAQVSVKDGGKTISSASGEAGEPIVLEVPDAKLWSPESPFLYDLEIELGEDRVSSYFGMRKISMGKDEKGHLRPLLNNKPIFMAGPLDQGYWPDGIYTAPTDEALKFDLEMTKKFGFNTTRKHVKIEPARWFYWCDKLGLLVWQDMPNGSAGKDARGFQDGVPRSKELAGQFELEMREMIREHYNHPSVIMWVIFNEAWGQYDTPRLTEMARKEDPTRLINSGSGWFLPKDCGDVVDRHKYKGTVPVAPEEKRIGTLGEFGGFGLVAADNQWVKGQTESSVYGTCTDQRDFENLYLNAWRKVDEHDRMDGTSAAIYTQLTDVETEVNGLMSYDRKVIKADVELFARAAAQRKFPKQPTIEMLVPTSQETPQEWRYTDKQPAEGWNQPGADLSAWKKGKGVFGHKFHRNGSIKIGTEWKSLDLWVVRTFELPEGSLKRPVLRIAYDDNATVYLNGIEALSVKKGNNRSYQDIPLPAHAARALKPGTNTLAIHVDNRKSLNTRQPDVEKRAGSQFIDAGIGEESMEW
ncbi:MAG: sulfatase-like hydrolase/transferase [Planctomycetota bacterium]|nr:sulfatase-like hydrolase/transferase [Planctomycetota bacterium]